MRCIDKEESKEPARLAGRSDFAPVQGFLEGFTVHAGCKVLFDFHHPLHRLMLLPATQRHSNLCMDYARCLFTLQALLFWRATSSA